MPHKPVGEVAAKARRSNGKSGLSLGLPLFYFLIVSVTQYNKHRQLFDSNFDMKLIQIKHFSRV
jgi:hypothetical protein